MPRSAERLNQSSRVGFPESGHPHGKIGRSSRTHLDVIEGLCHAFASAGDPEEVKASILRWVRAAVGYANPTVRLVLGDDVGRLRTVFTHGPSRLHSPDASMRREEVYLTKRPAIEEVPRKTHAVARVPLVCRGTRVGVLEVVAPRETVAQAMPTLQAVASQAAIVFSNIRRQAQLVQQITFRDTLTNLARDLLGAGSPEAALEIAVEFLSDESHVPVAAWLPRGNPRIMQLVTVAGMERRTADRIGSQMGTISPWNTVPSSEQEVIVTRFSRLVGIESCSSIRVREALILLGSAPTEVSSLLESFLHDVLGHLRAVDIARRRGEQLDMGLTTIAHEFLTPLSTVKAVLERLLYLREEPRRSRETLGRVHGEVAQLLEMVERILGSGVRDQLRRERIDLMRLARKTATSSAGDGQAGRIRISGPRRLIGSVDRHQVGMALSNVIRNALAYSPPESMIEVSISADDHVSTIRVADRGPGVPASEREVIFNPFVRGRGRGFPAGKGLGLFIARQALEAHGGKIWVDSPNGSGAVFTLTIPLTDS